MLKTNTAKKIFENKIEKEILFFPEEHVNLALVNTPNNGLVQTIQECYDNHHPLVLSPDAIWLTICQGVSIHINEQHNSLKSTIFSKDKPDEIAIRNDSLEYSNKHWKNLISSLANETKKYTNDDFYSFFVSDFTTTTEIEKTAYQVTLLESYKKTFSYVGETGCGIPSICITGSKKDWQEILKKLDMLDKIGLANWAKNLRPIIIEFINTFEGKQNKIFWQNIYKNASEYNGFYISGWIIKFFPYVKELEESDGVYDETIGETRVGEIFNLNKFIDEDNYLLSTLSTDNFPSGVSRVPVIWNNHFKNTVRNMEVYSGFFGIKQYADKSLEPFISWAICEKDSKNPNHILLENENRKLKHNDDYWSPNFTTHITDSAVYDIKRFKSQSNSLAYIKLMILDSLKNNRAFKEVDYLNDTIEIEVLSNGKTAGITMTKSENKELLDYIKTLIKKLPEPWFPALAHPGDVLTIMDLSEEENKIKVRANSVVKINL